MNDGNNKYTIVPNGRERHTGLTKLNWTGLVQAIDKQGIGIAKKIRFENPAGYEGNTTHIDGERVLKLWKEIEQLKRKKAREGNQ